MTTNLQLLSSSTRGTETQFQPLPTELFDAVEAALDESFEKSYSPDELLGDALTQLRGPLDSLSKRHGLLIEDGVAHAFAVQGERFDVATQVSVIVSKEALSLVEANQPEKLDQLNLPAADVRGKRVIIDVLAFDFETGDLHVVSVKRGGGAQGGQAARDARKDLCAAGLMLKNLMLSRGFPVGEVKKVLIDWYGRSGIIARRTVTRETVDAYFGIPVAATVEAMSRHMSRGIAERITPRLMNAIGVVAGNPTPGTKKVSANDTLSAHPNDQSISSHALPGAKEKPKLVECLSVLPPRRQGRQMRQVR
ncbi:MAG: hypothetical protein AAFY24_04620 [Pseudomonadota bacterium]